MVSSARYVFLLASLAGVVHAQSDEVKEVIVQSKEGVAKYADEAKAFTELSVKKAHASALEHKLMIESIRDRSAAMANVDAEGKELQTSIPYADEARVHLVFASTSMSRGDLRSLLEAASVNPNVHVIFRGVPAKDGVDGFMRWLGELAKGMDPPPPMTIDPPTWKEYGITQVPAIVTLDHGKEIARVLGIANPNWMDEQLATRSGDLGHYGETVEPAEQDMADAFRAAAAKIDAEEFRRNAVRQFWEAQIPLELPLVTEARTRRVDPSVAITRDVVMPDGRVLAKKGDSINPLLAMHFNERLIVIDAADAKQRAIAHSLSADVGYRKRVVVMSTRAPDADGGFDTWGKWQVDIGQPLYMLTAQLMGSLKVTHVPTMIEADGDRLVLSEMPRDGEGKGD